MTQLTFVRFRQVLGQIQLPRLPGAAGLTLKVQPQGGLVMRPEQS